MEQEQAALAEERRLVRRSRSGLFGLLNRAQEREQSGHQDHNRARGNDQSVGK
jgi:hypothetical protein